MKLPFTLRYVGAGLEKEIGGLSWDMLSLIPIKSLSGDSDMQSKISTSSLGRGLGW